MQNQFEVLSPRLQILKRPNMWAGSTSSLSKDMYLVNGPKIEYSSVTYIPAFKKLVDEILDNALDALIEHNNSTGKIIVNISDSSVYIEDNGPGIPVVKKKREEIKDTSLSKEDIDKVCNSYIAEIAWTRLFSGTNFSNESSKKTIGNHGVGSKLTNIFSTKFIGKTDDGNKSLNLVSKNNMETTTVKTGESSGKTGTSVEFWPDLAKFKLETIDKVYSDLTYQRLLCLAITFPNIDFVFNKKKINITDRNFLKLFSDNIEYLTFKDGFIGVFPNNQDEFNFMTYVNGLFLIRGGSHIDYISSQIITPIREKLAKKYKSLKPADIKNRFSMVVFLKNFSNPKYDSQTKDTLTNSIPEISEYVSKYKINFGEFAKKILKNNALIDPIIETFQIKEELKARQEIKRVKKVKIRSDKYMAPIGNHNCLALCEGASAMSGISSCLGRDGIGYYAMRGLPINAYDSSIQKIVANAEFKDIITILNLDINKTDDSPKTIDFDKILISTDSDVDGTHITSMLVGWFKKFAPNLFDEGKICKLITPLITVKNKKNEIVNYFFNVTDFKKWEETNSNRNLSITYNKGLGSFEREDLIELFNKVGLDKFILEYQLDKEGNVYIEDWLGPDAEKRKKHLRNYSFNIDKA